MTSFLAPILRGSQKQRGEEAKDTLTDTHKQTHTHTHTHTDTNTDTHKQTHRHTQTYKKDTGPIPYICPDFAEVSTFFKVL